MGDDADRSPGGLESHDLKVAEQIGHLLPGLTEVGDKGLHTYTHYGGRSSSRIDGAWISDSLADEEDGALRVRAGLR